MRYILLVVVATLVAVACERRPIEESYLKVYLDLHIERNITNYELEEDAPGLMRVVFFDAVTKEFISHDYVSHEGGYIFAPHGDVDMVAYNLEAGETHVRDYYSWMGIEAYTDYINEFQRNQFARYINSRVDTRPSYDDIRVTPGHLFVTHTKGIHIPQHITDEVFVISATARSVVESWTIEINGVKGSEWIGGATMMISGQSGSYFIARGEPSTDSIALYFDTATKQRGGVTISSRFETFGREKSHGDMVLLSVLFTDIQGHSYLYNFDVSSQMENNPEQHIVINTDIEIPRPESGGGFEPSVDKWKEFEYDIDI